MHKELVLTNHITQVTLLADYVNDIGESLHLDTSLCFNLNLALEEVVTNVISYAYPTDEQHAFVVIAEGEEKQSVTIRVIDSGVAFNPLEEAPEVDITLPAEDRPIGGLGIFLVKQIMDTISYERHEGKNILTMTKNLTL